MNCQQRKEHYANRLPLIVEYCRDEKSGKEICQHFDISSSTLTVAMQAINKHQTFIAQRIVRVKHYREARYTTISKIPYLAEYYMGEHVAPCPIQIDELSPHLKRMFGVNEIEPKGGTEITEKDFVRLTKKHGGVWNPEPLRQVKNAVKGNTLTWL